VFELGSHNLKFSLPLSSSSTGDHWWWRPFPLLDPNAVITWLIALECLIAFSLRESFRPCNIRGNGYGRLFKISVPLFTSIFFYCVLIYNFPLGIPVFSTGWATLWNKLSYNINNWNLKKNHIKNAAPIKSHWSESDIILFSYWTRAGDERDSRSRQANVICNRIWCLMEIVWAVLLLWLTCPCSSSVFISSPYTSWKVYSKAFWQWCKTFRITGFWTLSIARYYKN
jgi:hypothetical protein